jgi:hypothetical protein
MSYLSNRLCNPTSEAVEIKWHRGIVITIQPDSFVDLAVEQMDDFRPGKPGSEEVQMLMDGYGIFLMDSDVDYDTQALNALERCHRSNNGMYRERINDLKRSRSAAGIKEDDETFEENLRQMGLVSLKKKVDALDNRVKFYKKVVSEKKETKSRSGQLDPERTLFLTEGPPKEFPSKASKALFKLEHPELVRGDPAEVKGKANAATSEA